MLNEAQISLTGYVATQPVTKPVIPGVTNVSMRVAWTPRRQDRTTGEWVDGKTSYVTVICWRKLASNVATCVRKGDPVVIQGKLSVRPYEDKEGVRRISVEVDASSVGHDLSKGVAQFQRVRPQTGLTASEFEAARAGGQGSDEGEGGGGTPEFSSTGARNGSAGAAGGAAAESWAAGDAAVPMPDEPEQSFFDESAISELAAAPEAAAVPS